MGVNWQPKGFPDPKSPFHPFHLNLINIFIELLTWTRLWGFTDQKSRYYPWPYRAHRPVRAKTMLDSTVFIHLRAMRGAAHNGDTWFNLRVRGWVWGKLRSWDTKDDWELSRKGRVEKGQRHGSVPHKGKVCMRAWRWASTAHFGRTERNSVWLKHRVWEGVIVISFANFQGFDLFFPEAVRTISGCLCLE